MSRSSVGRNDPCPCGSGKKYKNCCLRKDRRRGVRARREPEIGLDPDEIWASNPSLEEIEARVQAALQDPEKRARMEAARERYAMLASQAEAEVWEWQQNAMLLVDREDAARLQLSDEEMAPWIPVLEEQLRPLAAEIERALAEGCEEDQSVRDAVSEEMFHISKEMAAQIFTPGRVAQLVEELQAYWRDLEADHEHQAAKYVQAAILSVREDINPGKELLLIVICIASIRALLMRFVEEARAKLD